METDPDRASWRSLAGPGTGRLEVRRSRFFAYARPLPDDADALRRWLAAIRAAHPDARHVVHAWRGEHGRRRGSDDGEPPGTGARPCHDALAQAGVRLAAVAVARVFGGVLLGTGNLSRAYGEAARSALAAAGLRVLTPHLPFRVRVPFGDGDAADAVLRAAGVSALARRGEADGLECTGWVPADRASRVLRALAEATAGRAEVQLGAMPQWRPGVSR